MQVGIGGWIFYGQPMALVRGLIRKGVRDLRLLPAFVLILAVLMIRPQGLFGRAEVLRV